jgi:hypothetical protein
MGNITKDFKRNNVDGVVQQLTYVKAISLNRISPASTEGRRIKRGTDHKVNKKMVNPLASEFSFKFLHTLYIKCE